MFYYLKKNKLKNFIEFFFQFLNSLFTILASVVLTFAINALVDRNNPVFFYWLFISLGCWITALIFNYIEVIYKNKLIQTMCIQIRKDILSNISQLDYQSYHIKNNGEFVSWLSADITTIEDSGFKNFYNLTGNIFSIAIAGVALIQFHYSLLITSLVLAFVMTTVPNLLIKTVKDKMESISTANEILVATATQWLSGFNVLLANGKTSILNKRIAPAYKDLADKKVQYSKTNTLIQLIIMLINIISQFSIIGLTGYLANIGVTSFGSIVSTGNIASQIFGSLSELTTFRTDMQATEVIFKKYGLFFEEHLNHNSSKQLVEKNQNIVVTNNLSFNYDDKEIVFPDLEFENGKKYAVVGESGSGKTTLLNILNGNYRNYQGSVTLNGVEIKDLSYQDLHSLISYVQQQPYLFPTTIRNNITLFGNFSEKELNEAVKNSGILSWVNDLPNGLDTIISENNGLLSGGQKQRVALARGIIRNKGILLIDEGTSSLDRKNADLIEKNIIDLKNTTVIIVTHHYDKHNHYDYVYHIQQTMNETAEYSIPYSTQQI